MAFRGSPHMVSKEGRVTSSPAGPGSPFLFPPGINRSPSGSSAKTEDKSRLLSVAPPLFNADLSIVLSRPPFWLLSSFVAVHILKLNFVVVSIDGQLANSFGENSDQTTSLVKIFSTMLPFGFVALPLASYLLTNTQTGAFQAANILGVIYGSIFTFWATYPAALIGLVFPIVAISRQLVYSTVFHQIGVSFGFRHYGVLLGLVNLIVSLAGLIQCPLVKWSADTGSFRGPNMILTAITLPLFVVACFVGREAPRIDKPLQSYEVVDRRDKWDRAPRDEKIEANMKRVQSFA